MERGWRISMPTLVSGLLVAAGAVLLAQEGKQQAAGAGGPFGLPTFAAVKEKCKPNEEQAKKLEVIFAAGTENEAATRKRAKDSGAERADLEKYLGEGRTEVINKTLEVLDDTQDKTFNQLVKDSVPAKKKKK
jgi:hypothetical protein